MSEEAGYLLFIISHLSNWHIKQGDPILKRLEYQSEEKQNGAEGSQSSRRQIGDSASHAIKLVGLFIRDNGRGWDLSSFIGAIQLVIYRS